MSKIERRWKDTSIDWAIIAGFDTTDYRAYCFNQQQVAILKAAILPYYWGTRWNNQTMDTDSLESYMAEIDYRLDIGCNFMLRQNTTYPCQLEQSFDNGETWSLAFDYSLCGQQDLTVVTNEWNTYFTFIQTSMVTYAGDIINIYPEWGYGDAFDADRDTAICWGLRQYVDWLCEQTITAINDQADANTSKYRFWQFCEDALRDVSNLMSDYFWYPGVNVLGGVLLLAANVISGIIENYDTGDIAALSNPTAREEIVCLMYGALSGNTPTYSNWYGSAAGTLTGDAETVRTVVNAFNQTEEGFVEWMGFTVGMIDAAKAALITNECLGCTYWVETWNFLVSDGGFVIFPIGSDPTPHGTWVIGEGWTCDDLPGTAWEVAAEINFDLAEVVEATVWYEAFASRASQSDLMQVGQGTTATGTMVTATITDGDVNGRLSPGAYQMHGAGTGLANRFFFSTSFNSSQGAWVGTAQLKGTGTKPNFF